MKWLRKLFRLPHPEMSRTQLAATLDAAKELNWRLGQDLQRACLHGYWRLDHPLSKVCPERLKSRHPKMTESEIAAQYRAILQSELKEMEIEVLVAKNPGTVLRLPQ